MHFASELRPAHVSDPNRLGPGPRRLDAVRVRRPFGLNAAVFGSRERKAQKKIAGALQKAQLTIEDVMAKTLESEIDSFERFDRSLASSEARQPPARD